MIERALQSRSPTETRRLGAKIGGLLTAGDVILLQGELGSGKTVLAQGIGGGLRVREPVKSSSFVLMNQYHGRLAMYHADLFRLEDPGEVRDLALEELASDGVLVVEWPERAWDDLPPEHLLVRFEQQGVKERSIHLEGRGERYGRLIEEAFA